MFLKKTFAHRQILHLPASATRSSRHSRFCIDRRLRARAVGDSGAANTLASTNGSLLAEEIRRR